jgi:hypothetical protein
MIEAKSGPPRASFTARLAARAAAIAEARAELRRRSDARRWRNPHLLWPLFTRKS